MKRMHAILLHLGSNMWYKKGSRDEALREEEEPVYRDYFYTDLNTWREITAFLPENGINTVLIDMGEAVELRRHPELAVRGTLTQAEFKADLARLRGLGLTPLPKFNFSCGHNAWMKDMAYRVGTPEYYDFCRDIIEETAELFDRPAYFHLGLEEEDPVSQKSQPVIITRSPEKKLADAMFLFGVCRACGARPWIWIDPLNVESFGGEEVMKEKMPRDVLMSNWHYSHISPGDPMKSRNVDLYRKLDEWGFDQMPTGSTWSYPINMKETMRTCKQYVREEKLLGFMTAPWMLTIPDMIYGLKNDAHLYGLGKRKYYPEDK